MSPDEFARLLKRFALNPAISTTGRHVYLWHGEENSLRGMFTSAAADSLDLHTLVASAARTPFDQSESSRIIQRLMEAWVEIYLAQARQHIVLVTGCDLLARYRVPLTTLFQWASDTVMFILVVQNTQTRSLAGQMPEYVSFQPQATFTYLKEIVSETAIIGTEG